MPTGTLPADAVIAPRQFTADAWIAGKHWRHHRVYDHYGSDSDLYISLAERIGKYEAFTPIHFVLADMVDRIVSLESSSKQRSSFTADAWIAVSGTWEAGVIWANSVIFKSGLSGSFTIDAVVTRGGAFTLDAVIVKSFTVNAFIV
jgi:hypothetical protein